MTVRQLIAELSALPSEEQDKPVFSYTQDGYDELAPCRERTIELATYWVDEWNNVQVVICDGVPYVTVDDGDLRSHEIDITKLVDRVQGICV